MPRTILVTEGSSPLGAALALRLAGRGHTVAATTDRDGSATPEQAGILFLPWNRRSPVSAHTVVRSVLNELDSLDEVLVLQPPFTGAPSLGQADSAEVERLFDQAKGALFMAREVLAAFLERKGGTAGFVLQAPAAGPVATAAQEAFRGMVTALLAAPAGPGIVINGFQGGPGEAPEPYAEWIERMLEERGRAISGRWFSYPPRGRFLQGVFRTTSTP